MIKSRKPGTAFRIPKLALCRETIALLQTHQLVAVVGGEEDTDMISRGIACPVTQPNSCNDNGTPPG